ncbi:MAG: zinc ribbon domain-containing protein [Oscillospiraceae bacterium]|jgi:uncharacterized membrane protein|nr:zinc ribbon domain-containing protein [Oscillospiraceae bacterium]
MAKCNNCKSDIEDIAKFCPYCGAVIDNEVGSEPEDSGQKPNPPPDQNDSGQQEPKKTKKPNEKTSNDKNQFNAEKIGNFINDLNNTADSTSDFEKDDIEKNKLIAIFSYLSILVIIPLFARPSSKFVRFHASQGLNLLLTQILFSIIRWAVTGVFDGISGFLGGIVSSIFGVISLVFIVFIILGIMNVVQGRAKELPLIGGFRILN